MEILTIRARIGFAMPSLRDLDSRQIDQAIKDAVERRIPAALTVRRDRRWVTLHAQFLAQRQRHLLLELPGSPEGSKPPFEPGDKVGLTFKLKHHKHICSVTVAATQQVRFDDGRELPVLSVCFPPRMQRLQRRAFERVDVPANRVVRASFWLGTHQDEPTSSGADRCVWVGRVVNLSAGGFRLLADAPTAEALDVGDAIGVRLSFAVAEEAVYADAQIRHVETDAGSAVLGFQFIGLDQTAEGKKAMELLAGKIAEYQRAADQASRRRSAS